MIENANQNTPSSNPSHKGRGEINWQPWALPGLALLALVLRLFRLDFRSLWLDEAYSLKLAAADLGGILTGAAQDIHPPLFHLLLAGWIRIFGTSEFALRALPALLGALLVPLVFKLAEDWAGRRAAWWTAGLVAVSPYFIEISRSGRMASLLALLGAGSIYFFWRFLRSGHHHDAWGYWAFTLAAFYTHYFAFLFFMAQHLFIFMGIGKLKLSRETRKTWMLLQMFLLVSFAPWLPNFWNHLSRGGPSWRGLGAAWWEPLHALYAFLVGTACWTLSHKLWAMGFLVLAGLVVTAACWQRWVACFRQLPPRVWGWLLTLLIVPLGVVWMYSLKKMNVFDDRYLSFAALPVFVLAGSLIARLPRFRAWLAASLIVAGLSVPLWNQYFVYGYYDNWRALGAQIEAEARPGDQIAVYPAWNETPLAYYLPETRVIQGLPGTYHPLSGKTELYFHIDRESVHRLQSFFSDQPRVWLVLVNPGETQAIIREWFLQSYTPGRETQAGGITLLELERRE